MSKYSTEFIQSIPEDKFYDVVVIGGGPSGLTAGLYLARAKYKVLVCEKEHFGGQITITNEVVNYPGVPKTDGKDLGKVIRSQAERFGAEFLLTEVTSLEDDEILKCVHTSKGKIYAYAVIICTGASPRKLGFKGEKEFQGRGVAYCATCDGEFFNDLDVFVVGGGFAAAEEAVFLTKYARKVTVLVRSEAFTCAKSVAEHCLEHPQIEVKFNTEVVEVGGENMLEFITTKNNKTGEEETFKPTDRPTFGVFVFAGYVPSTKWLGDLIELSPDGYVITERNQQTSKPGIYAGGDLCIKPLRQVVTSVADGAIAATEAEKYVSTLHRKTNIKPVRRVVETKPIETESNSTKSTQSDDGEFLTADIKQQLESVFGRLTKEVVLKVYQDDRSISSELEYVMTQMASVSDHVKVEVVSNKEALDMVDLKERPVVQLWTENKYTGLAFHGVPGGHEFQSFVLGIYNVGSKGQAIDESVVSEVKALASFKLQILISLSCTQCPELVVNAQRMASLNPNITVEAYDINHFSELKDRYKVMSVPCMIINDGEKISFGKKSVETIIEFLKTL